MQIKEMILNREKPRSGGIMHNRMQTRLECSLRKKNTTQSKPRTGRNYGLLVEIDNLASARLYFLSDVQP